MAQVPILSRRSIASYQGYEFEARASKVLLLYNARLRMVVRLMTRDCWIKSILVLGSNKTSNFCSSSSEWVDFLKGKRTKSEQVREFYFLKQEMAFFQGRRMTIHRGSTSRSFKKSIIMSRTTASRHRYHK